MVWEYVLKVNTMLESATAAEDTLRLGPLPTIRCPICKLGIDVSQAKDSEPLSTCHGWVVVRPVPGTLVGIVDFYTSQPKNA